MDLEGKRLLISSGEATAGVALSIAGLAQELGAEVALAGPEASRAAAAGPPIPRPMRITVDVDAPATDDPGWLGEALSGVWDGLEGAVHVAPGAPPGAPRHGDFAASMQEASRAFIANAHALSVVARATLPFIRGSGPGGSVVGVTVAEGPSGGGAGGVGAAFEAVNRYVACELGPAGVRVNVVVAGALGSAGTDSSAPGLEGDQTPLGWDPADSEPVARAACFLLSDWARAVSGEVLHVDGGAHLSGR